MMKDPSAFDIYKEEFNPQIHRTQFADHVLCYDSLLGKKRRIPKEESDADPNRYVGQIDCYGEMKSQATGDLELSVPLALQKMTSKIERSDICLSVGHGSGQAARSLVVQ